MCKLYLVESRCSACPPFVSHGNVLSTGRKTVTKDALHTFDPLHSINMGTDIRVDKQKFFFLTMRIHAVVSVVTLSFSYNNVVFSRE